MNDGWMIGLVLLIMVPVVLITTIVPYITRRIESFGVTIPEEAQDDAEIIALKKQYVWLNGGLGALVTASLLVCSTMLTNETTWSVLLLAHLFGYIIVSFAIYLKQHNAVKALKKRKQWLNPSVQRVVIDTSFRRRNLTVSYFWFIPHILLIIGTALTGVLGYEHFPEIIPLKYNLSGEVINSAVKSYSSVLWPVVTQSVLLIIFIFVHYTIGRSKQLIESSDPEGSLQRNILFRRRWSAFMMISSFLFTALFFFIQLRWLLGWNGIEQTIAPLAVTGFLIIGSIVLTVTTGQGGSRIKMANGAQGKSAPAADLDQYWKLGIIYFNPKDPALFVEKRFGVGMTMNFGRPTAWIVIVAIIALPLVMRLLFK
ncbi:DUF1648 domain-containing protein [Paenibacillus sp. GXUN7292]|uniref:DUF1648 domain-containing protein n=1 Tax=Paenibacillus sp. GXUN7292 TaxID=3422499 RepID=UPI003D7CE69A